MMHEHFWGVAIAQFSLWLWACTALYEDNFCFWVSGSNSLLISHNISGSSIQSELKMM